MKKLMWIIWAIAVLFWAACDETAETNGRKQKSSGKTDELLVVTHSDDDIKGMTGDTIRAFFNQEFEVLAQYEPLMELSFISKHTFQKSDVLKTHHNILMLDINPEYSKTKVESSVDPWTVPQQLIRIKAPDKKSLIAAFVKNQKRFLDTYMKNEVKRLQMFMKPYLDDNIHALLHDQYDIDMDIPNGFYVAKKISNFVWLRRERKKTSEGILIYFYPYEDTLVFKPKRIISYRDSITKMYIPGPTDGSYMAVEKRFKPPVFHKINFNGHYAVETRGLWRVEHDFMGGPFIHYTLVDEKNQRVVCLDAYSYNPNKGNRDMIIRLMAMLNTYKPEK